MANYYATWRSNYFRVKDAEKFTEEMEDIPAEIVTNADDTVAIMDDGSGDSGGIPNFRYTDDDEDVEIDWIDIFKRHLAPNSVAVLMESGHEKLRYVVGYTIAYNHEGDSEQISLHDIYPRIAEVWGSDAEATPCEY